MQSFHVYTWISLTLLFFTGIHRYFLLKLPGEFSQILVTKLFKNDYQKKELKFQNIALNLTANEHLRPTIELSYSFVIFS